ncbi:MAG: helix-turn-helix domain-containing protein [Acetatifactor sp.]
METYSVKQIADMLNTKPETVRRWIRSGKLKAEQSSRKDGNVITEGDLNDFLKSSPKYAGLIAGAIGSIAGPIAAIPLAGGIVATYLAMCKMEKDRENPSFSKNDVKKYLKEEIARRDASMKQKLKTIKQIQQEIANDQQQISECKFVLSQLEEKED